MSDMPWLVIGNFNEILYAEEKQGGADRREDLMVDFRNALNWCDLHDIGFKGNWFTWERGNSVETNVRCRLDRGVANENWWVMFPHFRLNHLIHNRSDHCPLLLRSKETFSRDINFKFEAAWLLEEGIEDVVRKLWENGPVDVPERLRHMGIGLCDWSHDRKLHLGKKKAELEDRLAELYKQEVTDDVLEDLMVTKIELSLEVTKEELKWEQRGRKNWLKNGDRNTTFFSQQSLSSQTEKSDPGTG